MPNYSHSPLSCVAVVRRRGSNSAIESIVGLWLTCINVRDDHARTLVREQASCFSSNALATTGNYCYLPGEQTSRVVEMSCDLFETL